MPTLPRAPYLIVTFDVDPLDPAGRFSVGAAAGYDWLTETRRP